MAHATKEEEGVACSGRTHANLDSGGDTGSDPDRSSGQSRRPARQRREALRFHYVGPLIALGIGALAIGAAWTGSLVAPTCSSCVGVNGWLLLGLGGVLVGLSGLLALGIEALVYVIRRGNLDARLRDLVDDLAELETSLQDRNSYGGALVVARF